MRRQIDFFINYEHKNRELESILLLKAELESRGYSVEIGCTYDEHRFSLSRRFSPKVVLSSALYDDGCLDHFVYMLFGFRAKVVNLQWEQVLTVGDELDPACYQNPKGYARYALHLCWGPRVAGRLVAAGVPEDRAVVVGPLHMDLLRPCFRMQYFSKLELAELYGLRGAAEWCIFISSYTYVNMSDEQFHGERNRIGDELLDFQDISSRSKALTLDWLEEAAKRFPDKEFIYRAHPSENADPRLEIMARRIKNFKVISQLPIKHWILSCDLLYTWYSTSIAEVFFANKNIGILRPIDIPERWEVVILKGAEMIKRKEDFYKSIDEGQALFPLDSDVFADYYDTSDQRPVFTRIADVLSEVLNTKKYDMPLHESSFEIGWRRLIRRSKDILIDILLSTGYRWLKPVSLSVFEKISKAESVRRRLAVDKGKNIATQEEINSLISELTTCMATTDLVTTVHE